MTTRSPTASERDKEKSYEEFLVMEQNHMGMELHERRRGIQNLSKKIWKTTVRRKQDIIDRRRCQIREKYYRFRDERDIR